jgi:hypothetical protein
VRNLSPRSDKALAAYFHTSLSTAQKWASAKTTILPLKTSQERNDKNCAMSLPALAPHISRLRCFHVFRKRVSRFWAKMGGRYSWTSATPTVRASCFNIRQVLPNIRPVPISSQMSCSNSVAEEISLAVLRGRYALP